MTFKHKLSRRLAAMPLSLSAFVLALAGCDAAPTAPPEVAWSAATAASTAALTTGDDVVALSKLWVYAYPSHGNRQRRPQVAGAIGVLLEGPTAVSGREPWSFWRVDFQSGPDGWVRADQIGAVAPPAPPPPPPSDTTSPPPPPPPPSDTTTPPPPPPPQPSDTTPSAARTVIWSSDWSTALGTTNAALTDGSRWSMVGGQGLEVISATGLNFPTPNVLRVTARGETTGYAFLRKTGLPIPQVGESNFYRWYFRATMPDGLEDPETHPFQDGNAASQSNWLFHVYHSAGTGMWRPQLRARTDANPWPNDRWSGPALRKHETYRFEVQIARVGPNAFKMNVRVYDAAGAQVHGNESFANDNRTATLASNPTFTFWSLPNLEGLNAGNNGIAGSPTWPFIYGYQAGLAVCRGDWCGPYRTGDRL